MSNGNYSTKDKYMYHDKFTGKPFERLTDRIPKQLKEKCENGHDTFLITNCPQCGAPVCCHDCCNESLSESKTE
jgi:hypothetical protein